MSTIAATEPTESLASKLKFQRYSVDSLLLTFIFSVYFALVMNIPIYGKFYGIFSEMESVNIGFAISIPILLIAAFNIIFNLFSWQFLLKPIFISLILSSSMVSYTSFHYGVIFDQGMIENAFETHSSEALSYVNAASVQWFLLTGLLPSILIGWVKITYSKTIFHQVGYKILSMVAAILAIGVIYFFFYKDYASVGRNNSYLNRVIVPAHIYSTAKFVNKNYLSEPVVFKHIGTDAKQAPAPVAGNGKPTLTILIIGETARSQNYQLNGYGKETNPFTSKQNVISFQDVSSCGTATAQSLPCLFSNFNRDNYNRNQARSQDNLLDIMSYAGISTLWKENDGGSKGVSNRIEHIDIDPKADTPLCDGSTCYDEILLENLDSEIAAMTGNKVIALHVIGSHGPTYYKRYPKEMEAFTPSCNRSDIENCTNEEIVNVYDNTIRYTDYVMSKTISKLESYSEEYNTALVYISDHGESLGENGMYLHGTPYKLAPEGQTQVPMIVWLSEGFKEDKSISQDCLEAKAKNETLSHDNYFHSMLGLMDVETSVYNPELDFFKTCKS